MNLKLNEGVYLVKLARKTIEYYLENLVPPKVKNENSETFLEKRGVFCTLLTNPERKLRGCIGIIIPEKSLISTVMEAACSSTQDPRFAPLEKEEFKQSIIELTILGELKKISVLEPREYFSEIKLGEDGLYLEYKYNCGVFLPQVPVEQNWDVKTYLSELCLKSGLSEDAWIILPVNIFKFKAQIFSEKEAGGEIIERELKK